MLTTTGGNATATIRGSRGDSTARRSLVRIRRSGGNHHNIGKFTTVGELEVVAFLWNAVRRPASPIPTVSIDVLESELAGRVNRIATRQRNVRICITVAGAIHLRHVDIRPNSVVRGPVMHLDIIRWPVVLCLEVEREVLLGGHGHPQGERLVVSLRGRDGNGA